MNTAEIVVLNEPIGTISPFLHGHFAEHLGRCCYDGLWVGRNSRIPNVDGFRADVIDALKKVGVPILRWPGGCFADSYHWRDGIGAAHARPKSVAESCGLRVIDENALGTHEFIALCRLLGAEPYLAGNVGSGSVREMVDWMVYCNDASGSTLAAERASNGHPASMNVRFWGVGNENWGCGGHFDAADYGKEFRRYATFLKMADPLADLVACGHNDRDWNTRVVEQLRNHLHLLDHLSVHQYWTAGHSTEFDEDEYYRLVSGCDLIEEDLTFTDEILRYFVNGRRKVGIAFDEWGVWHEDARPASNYEAGGAMRDAVAAAGALDVFHRWCDKVSMANVAQIVNVLQALVQTDGASMWVTPAYHVFALYAVHRGGESLRATITQAHTREAGDRTVSMVTASASRKGGAIAVSVTNRHRDLPMDLTIRLPEAASRAGTLSTLAADAPNAVNSAERPDRVTVMSRPVEIVAGSVRLALPACSVQTLVLH